MVARRLDSAPMSSLHQLELGITFWDTANISGNGTSEEIVGEAIHKHVRRDDIVLATKLFSRAGRPCTRRAFTSAITTVSR
jgi:aryl-alcohol dehydrogenase-like predicted oxidoreductase